MYRLPVIKAGQKISAECFSLENSDLPKDKLFTEV